MRTWGHAVGSMPHRAKAACLRFVPSAKDLQISLTFGGGSVLAGPDGAPEDASMRSPSYQLCDCDAASSCARG